MSDRGRVFLIIAAVVLVGLLLSARMLAGFYVDYLWHASVDRTDVFWGILWSKLSLFAMFGGTFIALAVVNLVIADRLAPSAFSANTHPVVERFHEFFGHRLKLLRIAVAVVLGLLFAIPTMGRWQDWEMFQNSKSFGINDPRFGNDVGFYLFKLPFVTFVVDWLFIALVFITILVILTHVLSGGIVLQPPRPKLRRATKAHIAVLLSLLALVKAGDYWLTRYELTTANRGAVRGITYAVDNAQLPAVLLLAMIAILTAALYLSTLKTDRWRPAVVASALWALVALIGGIIYPAAVQSLVVKPNQTEKEAQYIDWNIEATRHALGIDNVEVREVDYGALTRSEVSANVAALQDVRLWRPDAKTAVRFRTDDGASDTTVLDVDVDRYEVDGRTQQVLVGARELDLDQVGNRSWQGLHLINTHGCGLVTAPASQVNADDKPAYRTDIVDVTQPELYFSPSLSGYSIVNTSVDERACDGREDVAYEGDAGVQLNSVFRRLAFALDELDYNLIGSSAINDDSRLLSIRDVRDRVKTIAPFLTLDGDPYPVVIDGTVVWVIDAYTTSNSYPFGESADTSQLSSGSGLGDRAVGFTDDLTAANNVTVEHNGGAVVLTSNGEAVNFGFIGATLVGYTGGDVTLNQVFTVALNDATGTYDFTLLANLDYVGLASAADNVIDLSFDFTATDSDGDMDSGNFTVSVDDTSPVRVFDENGDLFGTYGTIAAGLAATADGYTVRILPGTYSESDLAVDHAITIIGQGSVVVDAAGGNGFVLGNIGALGTVEFQNLTIVDASGSGIVANGSTVLGTLDIDNVTVNGSARNGVEVHNNGVANVEISGSNFTNNGDGTSGGDGALIFYQYNGAATITNVTITGNGAGNPFPPAGPPTQTGSQTGIQFRGDTGNLGTVTIEDVTIDGSHSRQPIGFFNYDDVNGLTMTNVTVNSDSTGFGTAINFDGIGGNIDYTNVAGPAPSLMASQRHISLSTAMLLLSRAKPARMC